MEVIWLSICHTKCICPFATLCRNFIHANIFRFTTDDLMKAWRPNKPKNGEDEVVHVSVKRGHLTKSSTFGRRWGEPRFPLTPSFIKGNRQTLFYILSETETSVGKSVDYRLGR